MADKRIKDLSTSATEADLTSGNYIPLDGSAGTKKLPGNCIAPKSVQDSLVDGEKILNASVSSIVSMDGKGTTAVTQNFYAAPGKVVYITPSTTAWAVTSLGSSAYKLLVSSYDKNGTETGVYFATRDATVQSIVKVAVPGDSAYMRILFRGDVGETVDFRVDVKDAAPLAITGEHFEMGNITASGTNLTYGANDATTMRMRTKVDFAFTLSAGDAVFAKLGYEFYIFVSADGSAPYTYNGWVKRYLATSDVKAKILVRKTPEASTNFADLSNSLIVCSETSDIIEKNYVKAISNDYNVIDNKNFSVTFGGSGTTNWLYKVKEPKGTLLKITHNGGNWSDSSLTSSQAKLVVQKYKADGTYQDMLRWGKGEEVPSPVLVYVQDDMDSLGLFFRANSGVEVKFDIEVMNNYQIFKQSKVGGINHRGFNTIAPENTLPAFRLSAQKGFSTVETDVCTTSDGYIVCIHDTTVDRTSNGSGYVRDKTLAELKALDFGSWKSAEYAGTTIPTLEEFIVLCRNLGLSAYIEIKECDPEQLMHELEGLGALGFVSVFSMDMSKLTYVVTNYPQVRCGYVSTTFTEAELAGVLALRALSPNVFLALQEQTGASLQRIKDNHLPFEGWVYSRARILAADPYMSGFISDDANAKEVLFEQNLF